MKTIEDLRKKYKSEYENQEGCLNPSLAFMLFLIGLILYIIL